ncbi:MAG: sulfatase [Anaerolineae bacterium]|nr:sulfatase [Gemmatimonadaceae bacterium]
MMPQADVTEPRSGIGLSFSSIVLLAVWFALLTGLGEVTLHIFRKLVLNSYLLDVSPHATWMSPLANLLVFAIPALILILVRKLWPLRVSSEVAVVVFAFLAVLPPFIVFNKLHWLAVAVLAAGFAVNAGRMVRSRPHAFLAFANRSIYWVAAVIVLLATAGSLYPAIAERRALGALPPPPDDAPNVLLIVLDTVRALSLSLYGYGRPTTPNLERLAARGIRFDRAFATAPWTLPSHASMLTGHHPHETSANRTTAMNSRLATLATELSDRGYQTAAFVANGRYAGWESGLTRGFSRYEDRQISVGQMLSQSSIILALSRHPMAISLGFYQPLGRKHAHDVNAGLLRWQARTGRRPFFAFLNYLDAHAPYLPPAGFQRLFGGTATKRVPILTMGLHLAAEWPTPELRLERDAYDQTIAALDHSIGQLLDSLDRRGVLDNTLVVITSDHGEEFGEHGRLGHGRKLYSQVLWVPLVIAGGKSVPREMTVTGAVSLRDIPATVMAIVSPEARSPFPGSSLSRFWTPVDAERSNEPVPVFSQGNFGSSVALDRYHYIKHTDGSVELYDIMTDPEERTNIASTEEGISAISRLRPLLESYGESKTSMK